MGRSRRTFDARRYARRQDVQLLAGFFILLYLVGGALIWFFYGAYGALLGFVCMTMGLLCVVLLYGLVSLMGWWATRGD